MVCSIQSRSPNRTWYVLKTLVWLWYAFYKPSSNLENHMTVCMGYPAMTSQERAGKRRWKGAGTPCRENGVRTMIFYFISERMVCLWQNWASLKSIRSSRIKSTLRRLRKPTNWKYRPEPHSKAALYPAAWPGNSFSKEQLDRCTGSHLCSLSAFSSVKRFEMQHFQHNALFLWTGKRAARGTYSQRLFQAQPHSAQGSVHYAKLCCHSMQKCRGWLCRNEQYDCAKMHT